MLPKIATAFPKSFLCLALLFFGVLQTSSDHRPILVTIDSINRTNLATPIKVVSYNILNNKVFAHDIEVWASAFGIDITTPKFASLRDSLVKWHETEIQKDLQNIANNENPDLIVTQENWDVKHAECGLAPKNYTRISCQNTVNWQDRIYGVVAYKKNSSPFTYKNKTRNKKKCFQSLIINPNTPQEFVLTFVHLHWKDDIHDASNVMKQNANIFTDAKIGVGPSSPGIIIGDTNLEPKHAPFPVFTSQHRFKGCPADADTAASFEGYDESLDHAITRGVQITGPTALTRFDHQDIGNHVFTELQKAYPDKNIPAWKTMDNATRKKLRDQYASFRNSFGKPAGPKTPADGKMSDSRLFTYHDFGQYFNDKNYEDAFDNDSNKRHKNIVDLGLLILGMSEWQFKQLPLSQRIAHIDSQCPDFWKHAGLSKAEVAAVREFARNKTTSFDFLKKSCFRTYSQRELHKLANQKFNLKNKRPLFRIFVGQTAQELIRKYPRYFNNAGKMSASNNHSHEGGCGGLDNGAISAYQPHAVQGELIATILVYASLYRKHILEPILAALYPNYYKNGIWLTDKQQHASSARLAIQLQSTVAFVGKQKHKGDIDDRRKARGEPLVRAKRKIKTAQLISYAINMGSTQPFDKSEQNARAMLDVQMIGMVELAIVHNLKRAILTMLGMGAFHNQPAWMKQPLARALKFAKEHGLNVCMIIKDQDAKKTDDMLKICKSAAQSSKVHTWVHNKNGKVEEFNYDGKPSAKHKKSISKKISKSKNFGSSAKAHRHRSKAIAV